MAHSSRRKSFVRLRRPSRTSVAIGGGVAVGVVALTLGLTPGISIGALSTPVAPVIVPPASTRVTVTTAVTATEAAATTTSAPAPTTARPTTPTTKAGAPTTTAAPAVELIRIAAGPAQQGGSVTIQASGFRPNETVMFTIGGRKSTAKADARGRARVSYSVPGAAKTLLVTASAPSGSRTASIAVKPR
jgi:hypothetical protein